MAVVETYLPLYRKYRPQQFADLVGQDVVSTALSNALSLNKITHAYLFCGPRGTGKTSSARIFAKSLNCEQGPTPTPCQTCPSCVGITNGTALDVTEIDAASNNGVDNIREITDKVQFSALQGKYKIYIIDEVHMLSTAAFNALLKTLEEPPPNVVFIFATTEPHKVLPTIISRCQRFDFSRITREQIEQRLADVAQQEHIQIQPDALRLISRHVRGGMRDALGLLDQVSVLGKSHPDRHIDTKDVRLFIGALEEEILLALTDALIQKAPESVLEQIQALQEKGVEPQQIVKELTHHMRNLMIAKACGPQAGTNALDIPPESYDQLLQQAGGFATEELPQILHRLSLMEGQLRHSQQPLLWLEVGLLDIAFRRDIHLLTDLVERVTQLEAALSGGVVTRQALPTQTVQNKAISAQAPQVSAPPVSPPPTPHPMPEKVTGSAESNANTTIPITSPNNSDLSTMWQQIVQAISHMPTKALVKDHFSLCQLNDNQAVLGYTNPILFETFQRSPEKSNHVAQALSQIVGRPMSLKFELLTPAQAVTQPVPETVQNKAILNPPPQQAPEANRTPAPVETDTHAAANEATLPPPPLTEADADDLAQAKAYTASLLQAKLIDA